MSFLGNVWSSVQTVAKPFIAAVPIVGGAVASRINMSPTPQQQATSDYLQPTAAATGADIQNAVRYGEAVGAGRSPSIAASLGNGGLLFAAVAVLLLAFVLLRRK